MCTCCVEKKDPPKQNKTGRGYNKTNKTTAKWIRKNGGPKSEFTVRVNGGKKFGGAQWQKDVCGDGTFGFPTRRKRDDDVALELGLDGQWKKKRGTLVRAKSSLATASRRPKQVWGCKCGLWTNSDLARVAKDPVIEKEMTARDSKRIRANNRNNKARRGLKNGHLQRSSNSRKVR